MSVKPLEEMPFKQIITLEGAYYLHDTYTGESLCRHAEIGQSTISRLEKILIEKTPKLKLQNEFGSWSKWSDGKDIFELSISENCYTSPYVVIKVEVKDYSNVAKAEQQAKELHQATINGLIALNKIYVEEDATAS